MRVTAVIEYVDKQERYREAERGEEIEVEYSRRGGRALR